MKSSYTSATHKGKLQDLVTPPSEGGKWKFSSEDGIWPPEIRVMSLRLVGRLNYAKLAVLEVSAAAGPRIHLDCISEDIYLVSR